MAVWWLYGGYVFPVVVKPENLTIKSNSTLNVKVNYPHKTMGILTKVFCTFGPNLVVLACTGRVTVQVNSNWGNFLLLS